MELNPKDGNSSGTLALAEYRRGRWNDSIAASERSMALRNGGDANDWFLLALALWQQGQKDRSRSFFNQAVTWTRKNDPKNAELLQFCARRPSCWSSRGRTSRQIQPLQYLTNHSPLDTVRHRGGLGHAPVIEVQEWR